MRFSSIPHILTVVFATLLLGSAAPASPSFVAPPYFEHAPGTRDASLRLLQAARASDLAAVRSCLAAGADVDVWTMTGTTPIRIAIGQRGFELLRLLMDAGAALDRKPYGVAESALFDAVRAGFVEAVPLLIEAGVDIHDRDGAGRTPLHHVGGARAVEMIRVLVAEGADVEARDERGLTPLEEMFDSEIETDVVRALIDLGSPAPRLPIGSFDMGPLDVALFHGRTELARLLIDLGVRPSANTSAIGLPFYLAVLDGDDDKAVREVVASDPGGRDEHGLLSRLHLAAMHGRTRVVAALIEHGASVEHRDWVERTPLGIAAYYERIDAVQLLLERGADPNGGPRPPMAEAVGQGHPAVVRALLDAGAALDGRGATLSGGGLLHVASSRGDAAMVRLLLAHGAKPDALDHQRRTPLHDVGHSEEVWSLLMDAAADPHTMDEYGATPIGLQFGSQHDAIALALVGRKLPPSLGTSTLEVALEAAVSSGTEHVVEALLASGVDPNTRGDAIAGTLRFLTSPREAARAALLVRHGADVTADGAYRMLLSAASRNGHDDLVTLLLDRGADPDQLSSDDGMSPLEAALTGGHPAIAERLRTRGATLPPQIDSPTFDFLVALLGGHDARAIERVPDVDLESRLLGDERALDVALRAQRTAVVKALVDAGADVDAPGPRDMPPLHAAIGTGSLELVGMLLDAGADPNVGSLYGGRPLHRAVWLRSVPLADLLVDAGADPSLGGARGETAMELARKRQQEEMVRLLQSQ